MACYDVLETTAEKTTMTTLMKTRSAVDRFREYHEALGMSGGIDPHFVYDIARELDTERAKATAIQKELARRTNTLIAVVSWLEKHEPGVFQRGLWETILTEHCKAT